MSDRETELLARWHRERFAYEAWGSFVAEKLIAAIAEQITPVEVDYFLRLPVKPRTKQDASLLAKAFHRSKGYKDPYDDIEDKVGIRIVVLFSEEIRIVEKAITRSKYWNSVKARDFEEERAARPFVFDYQSVHYVVRASQDIEYNSTTVAANTPCEIQVRTILQHAYSELTHDTIYKPSIQAEPDVKRAAAKSMALIEATDDYFTQVRSKLEQAEAPAKAVVAAVDRAYREFTGLNPDVSPLNSLLIDHYRKWAPESFETELAEFTDEKSFLADRIKERASSLLFRQPACLLVYFAINRAPQEAPLDSPLADHELAAFYSDLGRRLPDA